MRNKVFYRVETGDGTGFYRSEFYLPPPIPSGINAQRAIHPPPSMDNVTFESGEHIFGFKSIQQMRDWFFPAFVEKIVKNFRWVNLYRSGQTLFVCKYQTTNRNDGGRQSVSLPEDLRLIKKTPFEEFFRKDIDKRAKTK